MMVAIENGVSLMCECAAVNNHASVLSVGTPVKAAQLQCRNFVMYTQLVIMLLLCVLNL